MFLNPLERTESLSLSSSSSPESAPSSMGSSPLETLSSFLGSFLVSVVGSEGRKDRRLLHPLFKAIIWRGAACAVDMRMLELRGAMGLP